MKHKLAKVLLSILPSKLRLFLRRLKFGYKLVSSENSYLVQSGYVHSVLESELTDGNDEYTPWMNYPLIDFLKDRLTKDLVVFEYGSGASTIFFAKKTKHIYSVEYDKGWFEKIEKILANEINNGEVYFEPLSDEYPNAIKKYGSSEPYDILIIDGRDRVKCAINGYEHLSEHGVVIFDDSHRGKYKEALNFYKEKGFKELKFKGLKPTGFGTDHSSILYRDNNCLGL